jgi:Fe-S cluster biosynthesis and repair protein YggX
VARVVHCVKFDRDLPGLEAAPLGGELGQRIFDNVSAQAWEMWNQHATLLMNHYGLSMGDPDARRFLREQMEEFFFGDEARMPQDFDPATAAGGRTKGGGGPSKK